MEEQGALAGYFRLRRLEGCVVVGLGLRPDLCGGGRGQGLMALIVSEATARYPGVPLRLEVRPGNRRAVRCYERAGFVPLETVTRVTPTGETPLLLMEYRPGGKT